MNMWIPMEQLAKSLDCRNHAGYHILSFEHALDFGLDSRPSAGRKFAQQFPVEARMDSQPFGDGEYYLSVRNWQTNLFGDVNAGH